MLCSRGNCAPVECHKKPFVALMVLSILNARSGLCKSFLSRAFFKQSSHGTVSSSSTACLVKSDTKTMSGHRVVAAIRLGNFICQSLAEARMPADVLLAGFGCSPTLAMACLEGCDHFFHSTPALIATAMVFRT